MLYFYTLKGLGAGRYVAGSVQNARRGKLKMHSGKGYGGGFMAWTVKHSPVVDRTILIYYNLTI